MDSVGSIEYITGWEKMQIKTSEYLAFIAIVAILINLAWPILFIYIVCFILLIPAPIIILRSTL
jgi:hypothetical protein